MPTTDRPLAPPRSRARAVRNDGSRAFDLLLRGLVVGAALLLAALSAACGGSEAEPAVAGAQTTVDTIADTVVVRTVSGSVWGDTAQLVPEVSIGVLDGPEHYMFGRLVSIAEGADGTIYAVDRQIPAVRVYDADGTYRTTFGRSGGGPGELSQPDGGLVVLDDGRVVVRDPGNARLQVYTPEGESADTWPARGGFSTSSPMYWDREGNVYGYILLDPGADVSEWRTGLVRMTDGVPGDTLPLPDTGYKAPTVEGRSENSVSISSVPFSPGEDTYFSPLGYFIHGISDEYSFTLLKEDGMPVRIERVDPNPVAVQSAEADYRRRSTIRNMRRNFPGWDWNGPAIPDTKPAFASLYVGKQGRVWVSRYGPGYEVENPDYDPQDENSSRMVWQEDRVIDVFEADGTFLGTVALPRGFSFYPTPVFDGDEIIAVSQDEFGVQAIVRYSVEVPTGSSEAGGTD